MRIGIAGSAGRGHTIHKLNLDVYNRSMAAVYRLIDDAVPLPERHLRSGGAPWADHIAADLYRLGYAAGLELHLPCGWDSTVPQFDRTAYHGARLNELHQQFSKRIRADSAATLCELQLALQRGARMHQHDGFKARNLQVGAVDWLIAITFGDTEPDSAGTLYTWRNATAPRRTHIQYGTLKTLDY